MKKAFSSIDKSMGRKNGRSDSQGFGRDVKNIFIAPKRTTIKRQKSKISLCPQTKIALNPQLRDDQVCITQYLKSKMNLNQGQIRNGNLTNQMRIVVVSWLVEISHKLKLKSQTIFHGIYLLDQMLVSEKNISLENFQLLAVSCLFVSSKYEEVYPPRVDLYSQVTDYCYSKKKIIDMEAAILSNCKFELTFSTRFTFMTHLCNVKEKRFYNLVLYLLELSLLSLWEDTTEDQIAQATVFLANKILRKNCELTKRNCQLAWKLMKIWKQQYGGVISYIFDCDQHSFVGGLYVETF